MIEITGKHNTAKCYTNTIEDGAAEQIRSVCDMEEFSGSKIRIMPDVHAGKGCTIGTTMTIAVRESNIIGFVGQIFPITAVLSLIILIYDHRKEPCSRKNLLRQNCSHLTAN